MTDNIQTDAVKDIPNILSQLKVGQIFTISQGASYATLVNSPKDERIPAVGMLPIGQGTTYKFVVRQYSYNEDRRSAKISIGIINSTILLEARSVPGLELALGTTNRIEESTLILEAQPDGLVSISAPKAPPGPYFQPVAIHDIGLFLSSVFNRPDLAGSFTISIIG